MRALKCFAVLAMLVTPLFARIGETETLLIQRFGAPVSRGTHALFAQGKSYEIGSALTFFLGDWTITCDLVDGTCARIDYAKTGNWTEENFQSILSANEQGGKWADLMPPNPNVKQLLRKWKRYDGTLAQWTVGCLSITTPLYEKGVALAAEKARNDLPPTRIELANSSSP